jgi:hypothetical protein
MLAQAAVQGRKRLAVVGLLRNVRAALAIGMYRHADHTDLALPQRDHQDLDSGSWEIDQFFALSFVRMQGVTP